MEYHLCVLLYSNYSEVSKKLLNALESCPVDIYNLTKLTTLCVDNYKIRKKIQNFHVKIDYVPTIIFIYPDSTIKKLDGQQLFDWIDMNVNMFISKTQPPNLGVPKKTEPPGKTQSPNLGVPKKTETLEQSPAIQISPKSPEASISDKKNTPLEKIGKLEDLVEKNLNPVAGVRNGSSNYDFSQNFGEMEDRKVKSIRGVNSGSTSSGIMATALAMQKERDNASDDNKRKQK